MGTAVPLRVLIVDDNLDQVHTLAFLVNDMGHKADYAINGIVALEMAQGVKPDVVLLDIRLPDASGMQIARQLHRYDQLKRTKIVGITGFPFDEADARAAGFYEVLPKPLDARELETVLERAAGE